MTAKTRAWQVAALAGAMVASGTVAPAESQDKSGQQSDSDMGLQLRMHVSEKEIGLAVYPGAKLRKDDRGDSPAANFGVWGKGFGIKLMVMKLESPDAPAKVSAFYQKALAKYGKVLDCSQGSKQTSASKSPDAITCDDTPATGATLYKAGTKGKQRIVGVEPSGTGSHFELVLLDTRGVDTDEKPQ